MQNMGGLKAISKCNKQQYIAVAKGKPKRKNIGNKQKILQKYKKKRKMKIERGREINIEIESKTE